MLVGMTRLDVPLRIDRTVKTTSGAPLTSAPPQKTDILGSGFGVWTRKRPYLFTVHRNFPYVPVSILLPFRLPTISWLPTPTH